MSMPQDTTSRASLVEAMLAKLAQLPGDALERFDVLLEVTERNKPAHIVRCAAIDFVRQTGCEDPEAWVDEWLERYAGRRAAR